MPLKAYLIIVSLPLMLLACKETSTQKDAVESASNKPIQHLELPELTSKTEALAVLTKTSTQLRNKQKLDATELHEIHMITYSLEKAIAYFVQHSTGEQKKAAEAMAIAIEALHLNSERTIKDASQAAMERYFQIYEPLLPSL